MRNQIIVLILVLMILFIANISIAQEKVVYEHPTLNIQFEASPDWKRLQRPEDKNTYEIVDPEGSIHVVVWHTTTEQNGLAYLQKMASMKDLILSDKDVYQKREVNDHEAFVLEVTGHEGKTSMHTLLVVIPHGKSKKYPKENYLFLIQIWCPAEDYEQKKMVMKEILASMEIK
jgi:hypothetical protein